jgi:hypothetical protein
MGQPIMLAKHLNPDTTVNQISRHLLYHQNQDGATQSPGPVKIGSLSDSFIPSGFPWPLDATRTRINILFAHYNRRILWEKTFEPPELF